MNDATLKVLEMVKDLQEGIRITIPGRGGWEYVLTRRHQGFDINIRCQETSEEGDPTGRDKFFTVDTMYNEYGAPIVVQEPTLGVLCRDAGVDIDGRIVGALVLDDDGTIIKRFSWSKLVFVEKRGFEITPTGLLFEQSHIGVKFLVGHLRALFLPNKNRMDGYVGVFGPDKPTQVKVLEMEDLLLASL
ncbi:MAG: hypothetical protein HZC05_04395 [Candidatus Magasanikbacteria bacterium]|nr:hypothetical protein [Candidatus Magasanikbacteria bacterium]